MVTPDASTTGPGIAPAANATLVSRRVWNERLWSLRVRPDRPPATAFAPGQFVQLGLDAQGDFAKRAYSIASSARELDGYELLVSRVDEGRLTGALWRLEPGARCWLDPRVLGRFTLEDLPRGRDLVMVATGTGVAPYVSMLRTYAGAEGTERRWRRFVLVHGVRLAEDLAGHDELAALAARDETVRYVPIASREPAGGAWGGLRGRVQRVLGPEAGWEVAGTALDPATCDVFLCGNPRMIEELGAALVERGFRPGGARRGGNLHVERYW